jgi:Ca2+-binding EF-hand superfamily protein
MRAGQRVEGGKFCRNGINCRGCRTIRDSKNPCFIGFLTMARRLLIHRRGKFEPRHAASVGVLSMLLALGAASSALDALQSLTSSNSSSSQSTGFNATNPFDISSSTSTSASPAPASAPGGCPQISPATMSALLAAQGQSSTGTSSASTSQSNALKDLFSQIDANGDGQISKSEFENALGAGGTNLAQADAVFNKLDTNGDGSVSLGEMSSALKGSGAAGHAHHHHAHVASTGDSSGSNANPLMQALAGASSTSVTNSDGSTTTSLTYADGSKVTMTSPAATTAASTATSSYNLIEQMIQRESQAISFSAVNPSLSLSA